MKDHSVFFYVQLIKELMTVQVHIRLATLTDLNSINQVIEAAVMSWQLPERVKRLSLPSYRYTELDFKHLGFIVAQNHVHDIVGVASWEEAVPKDLPDQHKVMLLHGIYVAPDCHHQGLGRRLFQQAEQLIAAQGYEILLVKAQADADGFFLAQGMQPIEVNDEQRDYGNRFWKQLAK